jgi:RNA methyltransferase, TrmH family
MRIITSRQNPAVHLFRELADDADPSGVRLLLDGAHLISEALGARLSIEIAAVASTHLERDTEEGRLARTVHDAGVDVLEVSDRVFAALSPVKTPSGIVAIVTRTPVTPAVICAAPDAFVLAAIDVQDPGNVGAIVRVGEAAGVTGVFAAGVSANPFSWKALRGSMGSTLRVATTGGLAADAALSCMQRARLRTVAAVARDGRDPDAVDWRGRVGLLVGGEGGGLADALVQACDEQVTIPMAAPVESLNVAVAAAILVYAARRQRTS